MNAKIWLATAMVLVLALNACSSGRVPGLPPMDSYVLDGEVRGDDGEPLVYASVGLSGSPRGAVTDDRGRFGIGALRPGVYGLTVVTLGFRSEELRFSVPGEDREKVALEMILDPKLGPAWADSLDPVTVSFTLAKNQ